MKTVNFVTKSTPVYFKHILKDFRLGRKYDSVNIKFNTKMSIGRAPLFKPCRLSSSIFL